MALHCHSQAASCASRASLHQHTQQEGTPLSQHLQQKHLHSLAACLLTLSKHRQEHARNRTDPQTACTEQLVWLACWAGWARSQHNTSKQRGASGMACLLGGMGAQLESR